LGVSCARAPDGGECEGFFDEGLPASVPSVWDGHPLAEATPAGRERFGLASIDERRCTFLVEFDDELAGAVIAAGEEVAVEA
jgi:hypothetical protein